LSTIGLLIILARWLDDRRRGYSPLAADLGNLQKMLAERQ
jgi:hypothetical protein